MLSTHDPGALTDTYRKHKGFKDAIDSGVVVAAFAGHLHDRLGRYSNIGNVPIISVGSAQYGTFTHVTLRSNSFSFQVVDHTGQNDVDCYKRKVWNQSMKKFRIFKCRGNYMYNNYYNNYRRF